MIKTNANTKNLVKKRIGFLLFRFYLITVQRLAKLGLTKIKNIVILNFFTKLCTWENYFIISALKI